MTAALKPHWTYDAFREGVIATLPLMPGLFAFGMAFGTVAARRSFSLLDALTMSGIVFSGVAQIIVVDAWPEQLTVTSIFASAVASLFICSRFLLIFLHAAIAWQAARCAFYTFIHFRVEPPWLLGLPRSATAAAIRLYLLAPPLWVSGWCLPRRASGSVHRSIPNASASTWVAAFFRRC